jgi:hypothetical protein
VQPLHGSDQGALMRSIRVHHASEGSTVCSAGAFGTLPMPAEFLRAFLNPNIILSERRLLHFLPLYPRQAAVHHSSKPSTHMNITIKRAISAETEDGQLLDIPRSAWADVERVAEEEFGAFVNIHFHKVAGAFHGPLVPFPHFLIEATLDLGQVSACIERIDPLIKVVVERHTQLTLLATK